MIATNGKILVSVDLDQKDSVRIGDILFSTALKYEVNYREKSPTIATVLEGNDWVDTGEVLICHHNLFYLPSPYHLYDNVYSVPFSHVLFATINDKGLVSPICGNIIAEKIKIPTLLPVPPDQEKYYNNRYKVISKGWTNYNKDDVIFTRPSSGYEVIYNINGEEKRFVRVNSEMICGVLKEGKVRNIK